VGVRLISWRLLGTYAVEFPSLVLKLLYFVNREFCSIVRKIFIYTKEEVQKMNSKLSTPRKEECSVDGDGTSEKAQLLTSSHLDN
jgi:hypothetical protein